MRVNVQTLGILPTNTAAQNSAALNALFVGSPDLDLYFPGASTPYLFEHGHVHSGNITITGDGDATVLDFDGPSSAIGLTITGSLQALPAFSSKVWQANSFAAFSANPSLVPGDVISLHSKTDYSWSASRPLYRKGEYCELREMGPSNVARLTNPLYDTYEVSDTDVAKLVSPKVSMRNMKVTGTTICGLIRVSLCKNPIIENITGYNEAYQVVEFDRCYKAKIVNSDMHNKGDGRDDYGLVLTNCQHTRVQGGNFYARRHGIAIGGDSKPGAVIGRDNKVFGAIISNDWTTDVYSADMHGNMEGCSYNDCTIYGGAGIAGRDNGYNNCTIYNAQGGWCVYAGEVQGGEMFFRGNKFITYGNPGYYGRGILDFGGNSGAIGAHTWHTLTINVEGNSVSAVGCNGSTSFMVMANGGTNANINININGLTACGDFGAMGAILRSRRDAGGVYSKGFAIRNLSGFDPGITRHYSADGAYAGTPLFT